jgi:hypothetical protein
MATNDDESLIAGDITPWVTERPDGTWAVLVQFSMDQIAEKRLAEKTADSVVVWLTKRGPPKRQLKPWVVQQSDGTWSVLVQFNMDQFFEKRLAEKIADSVVLLLTKWAPP